MPKEDFYRRLNSKLHGYYNYYGIRGNSKSLSGFFHQVQCILFKALNRRSQQRSYNWKGFTELMKAFNLLQPRICHNF